MGRRVSRKVFGWSTKFGFIRRTMYVGDSDTFLFQINYTCNQATEKDKVNCNVHINIRNFDVSVLTINYLDILIRDNSHLLMTKNTE